MNRINTYLFNILESKELAIFCGAGISRNSGLPLANELKLSILRKLPISKEDIDEIMNSNLPFESFMETLTSGEDISNILKMFQKGVPNTNHILIARMAREGYVKTILTTNFDLLIEKALEKEGVDFNVHSREEDFVKIDFNNIGEKISIFKIHGSADDEDSIRTILSAVASKTLSDKRINVIRYLFSTGNHKKVLVLGYSCSDFFDISPHIQSLEKERKEIIFIEHSDKEEIEEIEEIGVKKENNPFKKYPGNRVKVNTDSFIRKLWDLDKVRLGEYNLIQSKVEWKTYIDNWIKALDQRNHYKYAISGLIFNKISNFKKVIEYSEKALKIAEDLKDEQGISISCSNLGLAYIGLAEFKRAIECLEKALKIAKNIGNKQIATVCYLNLGMAYGNIGDVDKVIEYSEKALKIPIGFKKAYLSYRIDLNQVENIEDFNKSIKDFEEYIEIDETSISKQKEARFYLNLGMAYGNLRDFEKAIEYFKIGSEIAENIGDIQGIAGCYFGLSTAHISLKEFEKAIECCKKSLEIFENMGDIQGIAGCYVNLGQAYYGNLGDVNKAIKYYEKALEIAEDGKSKQLKLMCLKNLVEIYFRLGKFDKTTHYYEEALEIAKEFEYKEIEFNCNLNLGTAYNNSRKYDRAIKYYERCIEIAKDIKDEQGLLDCYMFLANTYGNSGEFKKATECLKTSLKIAEDLKNEQIILECYKMLVSANFILKEYNKTREYAEKGLQIAKEGGFKELELEFLLNLGNTCYSIGKFYEVIKYYEEYLEITKGTINKEIESRLCVNLAIAYFNIGNVKEAEYYRGKLNSNI